MSCLTLETKKFNCLSIVGDWKIHLLKFILLHMASGLFFFASIQVEQNIFPSLNLSHVKLLSHWQQNDLQSLTSGTNAELSSLAFALIYSRLFTKQCWCPNAKYCVPGHNDALWMQHCMNKTAAYIASILTSPKLHLAT